MRGEGGANSWKVRAENRGAGVLTRNRNGRLEFWASP